MPHRLGCVIAIGCVGIVITICGWRFLVNWQAWIRDYNEAEPLVQFVWPLSHELEQFWVIRNRAPVDLVELDDFAQDFDFSPLLQYESEFPSTGPDRFVVRVNDRYALVVNEEFEPHWRSYRNEGMLTWFYR